MPSPQTGGGTHTPPLHIIPVSVQLVELWHGPPSQEYPPQLVSVLHDVMVGMPIHAQDKS
ncbi:MAG: hypothetical protein Q7S09_01715 [bacterium]|nr:hypothetical protein [bacterium]